MRQAWAPLLFADEDQAVKLVRDTVAPAKRSDAAMKKSLMARLQGIVRNTCRTPGKGADSPAFEITTTADPTQKKALELIGTIKP